MVFDLPSYEGVRMAWTERGQSVDRAKSGAPVEVSTAEWLGLDRWSSKTEDHIDGKLLS